MVFRTADRNITFDLYLKLSDTNYAHIFSKSTGVDLQRLNHYRDKGVQFLYVKNEDREAFEAFIQMRPEAVISDPGASQTRKAAALLDLAERNLTEVFKSLSDQGAMPQGSTDEATRLIRHFIQSLTADPKSLALMLRVAAHGHYLYYHSLSVSVISIYIAKAHGLGSQEFLETCGLGGLLHDVGCSRLPTELMESPLALTPAQWMDMRQHTNVGLKMLEGIPISEDVKSIVAQHHEEPGGRGYPLGLRGSVIFLPAKIVAVADGFAALISKRPFRDAFTVPQALNIIKRDVGKWDPEVTKSLLLIFVDPSKAAA